MKLRYLLLATVLFFSVPVFSKNCFVNLDAQNIEHIETIEMRFCYITFVRVDGKVFLVKQKKPLNKLLGVVRDAITAHIAESFGIAHRVAVIPFDKEFPRKIRKNWPAT